ncbi:HPr Serine kinase C-terminal domain-containing protein [Aureimonas altamirensis DSM 21988]|uniref:HPr Serine kinase C-terminal domain-containing protein n=1 Tax=Aureimonas altamirensis DSM 21988 TaxID=1121026 RepID=A0ABY1IF61_9HYPH|nr:hypothetical protein [Aureimonas altamirensis]SHJ08380.1 HPr Serine kinase C-terminal domain-containing protein [Aureimonas altamirensis DSM 21988]
MSVGNRHAGLVSIDGRGVLILGAARSGKSALALCLIRLARREGRQAALVADDQVLLRRDGDRLVGASPAAIAGLLEISGVGIVAQANLREAEIFLVVSLSPEPPRLPDQPTTELCGLSIRQVHLHSREATLGAEIILEVLGSTTT